LRPTVAERVRKTARTAATLSRRRHFGYAPRNGRRGCSPRRKCRGPPRRRTKGCPGSTCANDCTTRLPRDLAGPRGRSEKEGSRRRPGAPVGPG
jgi:hypothetical protein